MAFASTIQAHLRALMACAAIGIIATTPEARAANAQGDYALVGAGALTCRAYMLGSTADRLYSETWWAGYMSAMNRVTDDTYDLMGEYEAEDVNAILDDYCRDNPEDLYGVAVHQVLEALFPERER